MNGIKTVILLIIDGWGARKLDAYNPITSANVKFLSYFENFGGNGLLQASGIFVGLDYGDIGSSEAGHISLGTGTVYYQNLPRINLAIRSGEFFKNQQLINAFLSARKNGARVHFVGLLSKKPNQVSFDHLLQLIKLAKENFSDIPVFLHLFSDGHDEPRKSFFNNFKEILSEIEESNIKVGTICGRFYALDTTETWVLRTQRAFLLLVENIGTKKTIEEILSSEKDERFNEFSLEPTVINPSKINDNDSVIFFNFNPSGIKQLFEAFILTDFPHFQRPVRKNLYLTSFVPYLETIEYPVAFPPQKIKTHLTRIIAENGLYQFKITERPKEKNLLYHFKGLFEVKHPGETVRILEAKGPLEKEPLQSAKEIIDSLIIAQKQKSFSLIVANIPCLDYLGHTGNFSLSVKAIKELDNEILRLIDSLTNDVALIITSDHGNIEQLINPVTGEPDLIHSANPVPFVLISKNFAGKKRKSVIGSLIDVAPTILELLNIPKPKEMAGLSLLRFVL